MKSSMKYLVQILSLLLVLSVLFSQIPTLNVLADTNYALQFDGNNDFVRLAETAYILGPGWESTKTVEFWTLPMGESRVCQYPDPGYCDMIFGDFPVWWGITRGIINGLDRIWIWNWDGNGMDSLAITYTPGEWVHIAMVHSNGVLRAYKNGIQVASRASGPTQQPATGAYPVLQIGGFIHNLNNRSHFNGQVDELRLWNIARSTQEIADNRSQELIGDEAGLKAYYKMSDGTGTTLTDDSPNSWNGTFFDGYGVVPPDGQLPQWVISTAFELPTSTPTATAGFPTDTPTPTNTPTPTLIPTDTFTPTPTFTGDPPTATATSTPAPPTDTPTPSNTPTPTNTPTNTPVPTDTPTPLPTLPPGSAGYALQFDGNNDYVRLPQTTSIFGSGWETTKTVELWIRPDGPAPVCQYPSPAWCDAIFGDRPRWWGISRGIINGQDRIWIWNLDSNAPDQIAIEYTPDQWVHIALVHSNDTLRAYKNGIEVGSVVSGTTQQPTLGALPVLQLGGVINSSSRNWTFQGQIDEVRLWNVARSASDLAAFRTQELTGSEAGLVAYYKMSDGSGLTLTDDSLNSWNGTLLDGGGIVPPDGQYPLWVTSGAFDGQ